MEKKQHVPNHQPEYSAYSKPPTSLHSLTTAGRVLGQRLFQTTNQYPWRIHGAAIYGNIDPIFYHQYTTVMLAYIPAPAGSVMGYGAMMVNDG